MRHDGDVRDRGDDHLWPLAFLGTEAVRLSHVRDHLAERGLEVASRRQHRIGDLAIRRRGHHAERIIVADPDDDQVRVLGDRLRHLGGMPCSTASNSCSRPVAGPGSDATERTSLVLCARYGKVVDVLVGAVDARTGPIDRSKRRIRLARYGLSDRKADGCRGCHWG